MRLQSYHAAAGFEIIKKRLEHVRVPHLAAHVIATFDFPAQDEYSLLAIKVAAPKTDHLTPAHPCEDVCSGLYFGELPASTLVTACRRALRITFIDSTGGYEQSV